MIQLPDDVLDAHSVPRIRIGRFAGGWSIMLAGSLAFQTVASRPSVGRLVVSCLRLR